MIPKWIHHVWPGSDPFRAEFHRFRASWFAHHPDWNFSFSRTGFGDRLSGEVRSFMDDPRYTAVVKSDVLRFELLRAYGGIYADTDMECLRPFEPLLGNDFFCGYESDGMLCPSLVGSAPEHPLTEVLVSAALERIRAAGPERANATPNEVSGPFLLTELARGRSDCRAYPASYFYPIGWWETHRLNEPTPGAYAKHWWNGATSAAGWTRRAATSGLLPAARPPGPVRYDLGGTWPRPGWVTVNLSPGADRHSDILELDAVHAPDGDVDEFLLEHTLEHVPVTRYVAFLRDLHRKLKIGGRVTVIQTDAAAVMRQWAAGTLSFRSMRSTLFTPEDRLRDNPLQAHQNMWSAEELARDFRAVGFEAHTFDGGAWRFDMSDPLYSAEVRRDHGKLIANLGVRALKRA